MLEPFEASYEDDEGPVTLKDNYPYFGDGTGRSEPITIRNIKIRSESEPGDPDQIKSDDSSVRRKTFYDQPRGTLEYNVSGRDTVDSVALQFGSTPSQLMRINHMSSRMIFPGQVIYVPDPTAKEELCLSPTSPTNKKPATFSQTRSMDIPTISQAKKKSEIPTISQAAPKSKGRKFGLRKSKSVRADKSSSWSRKRKFLLRQGSDPPRPGRVVREDSREEEEEADTRQFLKVDVKYITDGEGVVSGTMLVTPNAIMFDPNVSDPLVIDRGTGPYGVLTQMDTVLGASMYHDISAMNDKLTPNSNNIKCPVYIPEKKQGDGGKKTVSSTEDGISNPTLAKEGDIVAAVNGVTCDEADAKTSQELSSQNNDVTHGEARGLQTSESSEVQAVTGNESEVKGEKTDPDAPKIDDDLKPDSTSDTTSNDKSASVSVGNDSLPVTQPDEGQKDPEVKGQENDPVKIESMPLTSDDQLEESPEVTESSESKTKDVDLPTASSVSVESKDEAPPSAPDDTPLENMEVQEEKAADDLSKSAAIVTEKDQDESDQITDQPEELTTTSSSPDAMDSTCLSPTQDSQTSSKVGEVILQDAEDEDYKSEDEGVESDLDENEDETQPLVSPMAEHEAILSEELFQQRQLEGYSTLDNEVPGSASDELLGQAENVQDETSEVAQTSSSVAMDTETSTATNAKDVESPPLPLSADINKSVDHTETPNPDSQSKPTSHKGDDEDDESKQHFVDFSSGLFADNLSGSSLVPDITECMQETCDELSAIKAKGIEIRQKSGDELEVSGDKSEESVATEKADSNSTESDGVTKVSSATDATASKELDYNKTNLEEFLPRPAQRYEDPPLYLCLRVSKPMQKTFSKDGSRDAKPTGKSKQHVPEYWFAIPRDKADKLYEFFLQWTPDIYGKDVESGDVGFVVVDQEDISLEVVEDFFDEPISKDWEIITKEEANRRRMTILECEMNLPLPELNSTSELLEDIHIRKLAKQLPPRTEGYSWSLLYSTSNHGFSLTSLYRSCRSIDSPVLLVVKDADNTLFGALVNCGVKVSDHYYGTGETFLYKFKLSDLESYKWTGENNFFVKGDKDCLAIGGGDGTFGLWLDGDLYHGRSRSCKTFANEILSHQEDFVIANLEVWNFVLP